NLKSYIKSVRTDINNHYASQSSSKPLRSNLSSSEIKGLNSLKNDASITIKPADKGGAIVIMDTSEYIAKCDSLLNDRNTYKLISSTEAADICSTVQQKIRNLKKFL